MGKNIQLKSSAILVAAALSSSFAVASNLTPSLNNDVVDNGNGKGRERVIVKFVPGKSQQVKALTKGKGGEIKVDLPRHNAFAMEIPSVALKGLQNNPNIEYIEPDVQRQLLSTNLNTTEISPWGISRVEADVVSDSLAGNTTLCIIDSGYDIRHSDLSTNAVSGTNDSGTGDWSTPGGSHGTHVAGTIAGVTNGSGVVGVMPNGNINLHIIKVFNESGWGYSSSLVAAADACISANADVISMSLGGSRSSRTELRAFRNYYNQGVLSIAAAGNDGNTAHSYPASYDDVVSVAAVDSANMHANFSQSTNQVELSGPGEAILSSVGLGDGQLAQLTVDGVDFFANGVVPHTFYDSSLAYAPRGNDGSVSGTLGVCTTSGGSYSCGDMTGKICLVERGENQEENTSSTENTYPEYRGANACADAGAIGVVLYSNSAKPGLQNPFLVDFNGKIEGMPTASVDRATGLQLAGLAGKQATLSKSGGEDWEYYNGTSMATPHVSAVAALVWSHHQGCSAAEVRDALAVTAEDLDATGRDNNTGYGMVKAEAAVNYLAGQACGGGSTTDTPPTASFAFDCTELACSFSAAASSDDTGIAEYSWQFGDGSVATGVTADHTYSADGSYEVTLTVEDIAQQTDSTSKTVTVSSGAVGSDISLSVTSRKVKGSRYADLVWSGANSSSVDIYRNGSVVATTSNDGSYSDLAGRGTYTYMVCESGTSTCSDVVTVSL